MPPIGGNDGELTKGYQNTVVTTEAAHSGLKSLKFDLPFDRETQDGFVGARRVVLDPGGTMELNKPVDITKLAGVTEGDHLRLTVWLKGSNLVPDSAAIVSGDVVGGVDAAVVRQGREQRRVRRDPGERLHVAVPGGDVL